MKRLLTMILGVAMLFSVSTVQAQEAEPTTKINPIDVSAWLESLPNLKQGAVYSVNDSEIKYCSTTELIRTRYINVEVGAVPTDNEAIVVLSYEVLKLKDYVGIPLLDLVELNVGVYAGVIDVLDTNEFDWGASATAINVKF